MRIKSLNDLPPHIQALNRQSQPTTGPSEEGNGTGTGVDREGDLHDGIMAFCDSQWPRWKYRHARMDKPTTEEKGVEDFTIFMPGGRTLHVECKKRLGKLDEDQRNWKHELERLGHTVHVVRSMEEFRKAIQNDRISDPAHKTP